MPSKLQQFKRFQSNPEFETFRFFNEQREQIKSIAPQIERKVLDELSNNPFLMQEIVQRAIKEVMGKKEEFTPVKGKDYFTEEERQEIINFVQSQIRMPEDGKIGARGERGERGPKGEKGDPGDPPKPLQAGVDYPTKKQVTKIVSDQVYALFSAGVRSASGGGAKKEEKKVITKEEVFKLIGSVQEKIDFKERAKEIARALETLKGTEQLDYLALKNRPVPKDDYLEKRFGGGGGGGMGNAVHQTFDGDGVTTEFSLSSRVAAEGNAIWVRYQGQMLTHTTHYTVSGKTLVFTFTPANGTKLDVTFIRT